MRIQVNCSEEMVKQIDKYAEAMGVSRSSLCSMLIGQGVMGFNKSFEVLDVIGNKLGDSMLAERAVKEFMKKEEQ